MHYLLDYDGCEVIVGMHTHIPCILVHPLQFAIEQQRWSVWDWRVGVASSLSEQQIVTPSGVTTKARKSQKPHSSARLDELFSSKI